MKMIANNIVIEQFLYVLNEMKNKGISLVNLELAPDDNFPDKNKLILHPVIKNKEKLIEKIVITNKEIDPEVDDIYDSFEDVL